MAFAVSSLTAGSTPDQVSALRGQNHDNEIYTCAAVFSTLALCAVIIRVTSRHMKNVTVGLDDVMVIVALVITLAQTIVICIGVRHYGLGRHSWTLNEGQLVMFNKLWYTVDSLQCTSLFLTKISHLILLFRIFVTPALRFATKVLGTVVVLWWIGTMLAVNLICIPAHCGNKQLLAIIPPIPWIVTDLVILLMPLPTVWNLHLPRPQRVGLAGLFLLDVFAVVSSCVRYSTLIFQHEDITYYIAQATIWTIIESDVTIISACLIVSRPLLPKLYPSKLVIAIRDRISTSKKSSSKSSSRGQRRLLVLSIFRILAEAPPAVATASFGAPFDFKFDIERGVDLENGMGRSDLY